MKMHEKELIADVAVGNLELTIHYVVRYLEIPNSEVNAGELEIRGIWHTNHPDEHLDEEEVDHFFSNHQDRLLPLLLKTAMEAEGNEPETTPH